MYCECMKVSPGFKCLSVYVVLRKRVLGTESCLHGRGGCDEKTVV
jgi:hypothetical protein